MYNDLLMALDNQKEAVLVLLDLTAAFDTIDHDVLLDRLHKRYGIKGVALKWFSSYLKDRQQVITIDKERSQPVHIKWGIP